MSTETVEYRTRIKPTREKIYIQRLREEQSSGGILFPSCFKAGKNGFSAREKINAVPDTFYARVLAVGPEVRELAPGDEVIVYSYAAGDGKQLWTGTSVGERDKIFIDPDDVVCAVER